jgi:hypothetical protein
VFGVIRLHRDRDGAAGLLYIHTYAGRRNSRQMLTNVKQIRTGGFQSFTGKSRIHLTITAFRPVGRHRGWSRPCREYFTAIVR